AMTSRGTGRSLNCRTVRRRCISAANARLRRRISASGYSRHDARGTKPGWSSPCSMAASLSGPWRDVHLDPAPAALAEPEHAEPGAGHVAREDREPDVDRLQR